jgi:hypothetical protein
MILSKTGMSHGHLLVTLGLQSNLNMVPDILSNMKVIFGLLSNLNMASDILSKKKIVFSAVISLTVTWHNFHNHNLM